MKLTGLTKLLMGSALTGSLVCCNIKEKQNKDYSDLGHEMVRPPITKILDTLYKIQIIYDDGSKSSERLKIVSHLSSWGDALYFANYTSNYDTQNWDEKEKLPIAYRHTKLNSEWSEIYIIHSKEIKISDINQTAYFVPQYEWEELKPLEEHKEAQLLIKESEKLLDWTLDKIPFSEKVLNIILKKAEKTTQEYYSELLNKTNENYIIEKIPAHIPTKLFDHTETAREYEIAFNLDNLNEPSSETYLVANIFLGDPSKSSGNSFQNKRGELEEIIIKFNLKGKEIKEKPNEKTPILSEERQKISKKEISVCIDYIDGQYGKRRDGKSDIAEVIFYIRKENANWKEFDKSQNVCANKKIILENPNSFVEIKATGKFENGRGNGWIWNYASQGKKISWDSEENIKLSQK